MSWARFAGTRSRRPKVESAAIREHEDDWAWPGRPDVAAPPPDPDPAASSLTAAVDVLLEQAPAELPGPVALARARVLLCESERLAVAIGTALVDVDQRELFAHDAAGSVQTWLRRQPAGDGGRLGRARRLAARPAVRAAVASGALGVAAADLACRALDGLPEMTEPGQVEGVLENGVPDLLGRWTAGEAGDEVAAARRETVAQVVAEGVAAIALAPSARLEPAFTLIAQALAPHVLAEELQQLVDALLPERLADESEKAYVDRGVRLRRKRSVAGWTLTGDLTDEVGAALQAELECRAQARKEAEARLLTARESGRGGPEFGTVGPGTSVEPGDGDVWAAQDSGPRPLTDQQLAHDLLAELLDDVAGVREPGARRPATITITAGLAAAEGLLGALPGSLETPVGRASLTRDALRRAGCDGVLSAVLLDAARNPIGASGTHRHATERERRALKAKWGHFCAEDGCPGVRTVPHHGRPWWLTGTTTLEDLIPVCDRTHHAIHDEHRTIRLRDGRMINGLGWVHDPPTDPCPGEPSTG